MMDQQLTVHQTLGKLVEEHRDYRQQDVNLVVEDLVKLTNVHQVVVHHLLVGKLSKESNYLLSKAHIMILPVSTLVLTVYFRD